MEPFLENLFLLGSVFQDQRWFCLGKLRPCDLFFAVAPALCGLGILVWSRCQGPQRHTFPCLLSGRQSPGRLTPSVSRLFHGELEGLCCEFVIHEILQFC